MIQDQGKEEERLKREEERLASYRLIRELQQDEGEEEERLKRERERLNREEEERLTREAEAQRNERFIQDLGIFEYIHLGWLFYLLIHEKIPPVFFNSLCRFPERCVYLSHLHSRTRNEGLF